VLAWDGRRHGGVYKPIVYGDPTTLSYLIGKWWTVKEKLTTSYIRGDHNHVLSSSVTLKGNSACRSRHRQSSNSFFHNSATNAVTPFTGRQEVQDVLPGNQPGVALPEQQAVRLGLAKEVAVRAWISSRRSGDRDHLQRQWCCTPAAAPASQARPVARRCRGSVVREYFSSKAYISGAVFYKKLKSTSSTKQPHDSARSCRRSSEHHRPTGPPARKSQHRMLSGAGERPRWHLKGIELTASLPGHMISDALATSVPS